MAKVQNSSETRSNSINVSFIENSRKFSMTSSKMSENIDINNNLQKKNLKFEKVKLEGNCEEVKLGLLQNF